MKETWEEAKDTNISDGVEASPLLNELIKKNINEEISIEEIVKELVEYYENN